MTLKRQVEQVLQSDPETRNSDITLTIEVWKKYYSKFIKKGVTGELGVWLKDLFELPREDNIKRIRAHFQNDLAKYLPTSWKVARQRKINEDVWRRELGYPPKRNPLP